MKFPRNVLHDMVYEGECMGLAVVSDTIWDRTRWSILHRLIFKDVESGKFYETIYSEGATEQHDLAPFQYEPDEIECDEVVPVERITIVYERVKQNG